MARRVHPELPRRELRLLAETPLVLFSPAAQGTLLACAHAVKLGPAALWKQACGVAAADQNHTAEGPDSCVLRFVALVQSLSLGSQSYHSKCFESVACLSVKLFVTPSIQSIRVIDFSFLVFAPPEGHHLNFIGICPDYFLISMTHF